MNRIYRKVFKSRKPSLGSLHGPAASTLTSTGTTDLMASIPAFDTDVTASAQITAQAGDSVRD